MKIQRGLIFLIFSLLLPAALAGAVACWMVYSEQLEAQQQTFIEATRVLAELVDKELESSEKFLVGLASSPDLAEGNLERFHQQAQSLTQNGEITIVLSDLQGNQILNTRLPWGPLGNRTINPRLRELRMRADPGSALISDLFFAPIGKRHDFAVQIPVFVKGTVKYYLSKGMPVTKIGDLLTKQGFPPTWIATVVDRTGLILTRTPDADRFTGQKITGGLAEKVLGGATAGINDGTALSGTKVRAFFQQAKKSQWTIVLSVPSAELRQASVHASLLLAALFAFILVSALTLTRRYVSKILDPIESLRDNARRLASHEIVPFEKTGFAELDEVSHSLASASTELFGANQRLEQRVADAIASTERAQRALQQASKLEALGRLTGGVAHDFNNVLQTLSGALQLIRLEGNLDRIPKRLDLCERAVERATGLVAQLRAFGRVQDIYLQTIHTGPALLGVLDMLKNTLPSGIHLQHADIPDDIGSINVDVAQLEITIINLVMNARDAIQGSGQITVSASNVEIYDATNLAPGSYVSIQIRDSGAGMPPEVLAKAFDPFFTTKPVDKGSGLGLPQAYGFAKQSQGDLILESEPGKGTTATLLLPACEPLIEGQAQQHTDRAARPSKMIDKVVLVVEDDTMVRETAVLLLERLGATVIEVASGDEAVQVLEDGAAVDIVFSDVLMPGSTDGVQLAKFVQARYPHIAIVLTTGYTEKTIDLPGIHTLSKPYTAEDACAALLRASAVTS